MAVVDKMLRPSTVSSKPQIDAVARGRRGGGKLHTRAREDKLSGLSSRECNGLQ
jgi:hypothetical protein